MKNKYSKTELLCKICQEVVELANIRAHLMEHNQQADKLDWEDVRDQFDCIKETNEYCQKA